MNQIRAKRHWYLALIGLIAFAVGMAGFFGLRTVASRRAPIAHTPIPLPALDRTIARLAIEARATTIATNSGGDQARAKVR
jgi:hypothetical protein